MSKGNRVGVAIVGCGIVGGAAAVVLTRDRDLLSKRSGLDIELRHIVDKDFTRARSLRLPEGLFRASLEAVLADAEVSIIVETVGGTTFARDLIKRALEAGKHVVTANKALLAHHGVELFALARARGLTLSFEASCGGGIPIIRALYDGLIANRIDAIYGIVNGTCNSILTEMIGRGADYADALTAAQEEGLAEADPTLDVSGMDSAHKITILASLAFGTEVDLNKVPVEGIDRLEATDVAFGMQLGYVVKLLAVAHRIDGGVSARVRPSFISRQHPLAWVSGAFNAISVYGHLTGHTMYYGRGAGGSPTASAVIADIVSSGIGAAAAFRSTQGIWPEVAGAAVRQVPVEETSSRFYLRLTVEDHPGVLADVASILARHSISISSVLQKEMPEPPPECGPAPAGASTRAVEALAPVVIITHPVIEKNLRAAVAAIAVLPTVSRPPVVISIVDEHEEGF